MPALPQQMSPSAIGTMVRPGNRRQQVARRLPDALRVREVTGVVVGDAQLDRVPRGADAGPGPRAISVTSRTLASNAVPARPTPDRP